MIEDSDLKKYIQELFLALKGIELESNLNIYKVHTIHGHFQYGKIFLKIMNNNLLKKNALRPF